MAHENDWIADQHENEPKSWSSKTWPGNIPQYGVHVWSIGDEIYYSNGSSSNQYVLNKTNLTWETKTWSGLYYIYGFKIWTDGDDYFYSNAEDGEQYVLDQNTSRWNFMMWSGFAPSDGAYVWNDGENVYYSKSSAQYVLDKATSIWSEKTWNGLTSFDGNCVWADGENIYYSKGSAQYVLDKATSTWSEKNWNGLTSFDGSGIWRCGDYVFYSVGNVLRFIQYILDRTTSTWYAKSWNNSGYLNGKNVWTDGENIYSSNDQYDQRILNREIVSSVPYRSNFPEMIESVDLNDKWVSDVIEDKPDTLVNQNWGGFSAIWGQQVWTDGENIYYLGGLNSYVLNRSEKTWEPKTWYGLDSISGPERTGSQIWTDGEDVYYSDYRKQFVLDKATSTWTAKTWNGRSEFYGSNIWTDGENIYLSGGNANYQYVLDKATSTWEVKTWSGYQNIIAGNVWFDGDIMYYSAGSNQYVFDKATSTWIQKTWYGFSTPQGSNIWSRNGTVYYSDGRIQYVLDRATSTWSAKTWEDVTMLYASGIWTDGEEMYYSYNANNQYRITDIKITTVPYRYDFPEMIESVDIDNAWITHDVPDEYINAVPYRPAFPALVESVDISDKWLISDDIPFRLNFPELIRSTANPVDPPSFFTFKGRSSAEFGSIEILPLCLKHEEKTDFINFITGTPYVLETSILRSKVITITINLKDISPANIDRVNSWLIGTGKLVLSHDPHRYYIATCNNALTGQKLVNTLGKVAVQFNVMPYKYDLKEKESFEPVDLAEETLHKTAAIYYKGSAPAESTFKITATGNIEIYNVQTEKTVEIKGLTEYCIIDIKARKVTDESNLNILNRTYGDIFDLMLVPGYNYFFLSGSVTAVEVKKKTRWY